MSNGLWRQGHALFSKMLVEEARDFGEDFLRLRHKRIETVLGVGHPLEYLQVGLHSRAAQLAMRQNGQAQKQVARAAGENRRRETGKVAVDGRDLRIFQIVPVSVKLCSMPPDAVIADEDVV